MSIVGLILLICQGKVYCDIMFYIGCGGTVVGVGGGG